MNLKTLILSLFFILGLNQSSFSQSQVNFTGDFDVIGDKLEVLVDSNSTFSIQSVINSNDFKKTEKQFPNLLITDFSYWVRFNVKNSTDNNSLAIQVAQPTIDYIECYELKGDSLISFNSSGQRRPFYNRLISHQTYIYPSSIAKDDIRTFYFHVKSGKQLMLPIYLGSIEQVIENALIKDITFGIYIGIILVMLLYNLFIFVSVRDKNYLYYIAYLIAVLLAQASMEGYLFRFFLPNSPLYADIIIYISTALIGIAAIEFSKSFLSSKTATPILHKISYVFWVLYSVQVLLALKGLYNESYNVMLVAGMTSAIYVLYMAISIFLKGSRSATFFLIAWSVFIICVVIYGLKDFGIVPYSNLTNSALLIGSAFEAIMISFALADRINVFKAEKEQSQEETLNALKENERIIKEQNVILEHKVQERTTELVATNDELSVTLVDLKEAQSQLVASEKMASLGQLTAGIAHEINNPINFVTSNISPLTRDVSLLLEAIDHIESIGLSEESKSDKLQQIEDYKEELDFDYLKIEINHLLKGIGDGASRTAEIVKGLRVFSRLDEDDLKKADINEGLDSTLIIMNSALSNGKIKVVKEYSELPVAECYPGKLNQVFLNIISNAIHAITKVHAESGEGELKISTKSRDDKVYISIKDNGLGMNEATMSKIFDPFFTTKDVGEGTGLGMSIAYNTIKNHSGEIIINSKPGEGTEMIIQIPIIHKIIAT